MASIRIRANVLPHIPANIVNKMWMNAHYGHQYAKMEPLVRIVLVVSVVYVLMDGQDRIVRSILMIVRERHVSMGPRAQTVSAVSIVDVHQEKPVRMQRCCGIFVFGGECLKKKFACILKLCIIIGSRGQFHTTMDVLNLVPTN